MATIASTRSNINASRTVPATPQGNVRLQQVQPRPFVAKTPANRGTAKLQYRVPWIRHMGL